MEQVTLAMLEKRAAVIAAHMGAPLFIDRGSRTYGRMWRVYVERDGSNEIARAWTRAELFEQLRAIESALYYMERKTAQGAAEVAQ